MRTNLLKTSAVVFLSVSLASSAMASPLTQVEKNIAKVLVEQDLSAYASRKDSVLRSELNEAAKKYNFKYIETTYKEMTSDYTKNQIYGNQKYDNALIFFTGKVKSISTLMNNNPIILFGSFWDSNGLPATLDKPDIDRLAQLKKNIELSLVCLKGDFFGLGLPSLRRCQFIDEFTVRYENAVKMAAKHYGTNSTFEKDVGATPYADRIIKSAVQIASMLDEKTQEEIKNDYKSNTRLISRYSKKTFDQNKVSKRLEELGLK